MVRPPNPRHGVSLRVRLLAGLLVLMTVGIGGTALASVLALRAYLHGRDEPGANAVPATIDRLVAVEATAGVVVLVITASSAWLMLGRGLRPLRDVAETASAIAEGDLSRRVPPSPVRGETGRLAVAINVMLGQIQTAFDERGRSRERLRRFVADASHELRTPLTSIRGYIDLLRQGAVPPEEVDDALRRVQAETRRMGALVDDLLYLADLDEQPPLEQAEVDLAVVVREAVADASVVEPDREITLVAPATCVIVGDADALRQIVGNLLANVRVHTPTAASVTVAVTRPTGTGPADEVRLEVRDRGPGMPPEAVERVFDRFYRVSGSRDRARGGSGLGMSIVAAATAAHRGRAEVRSTVGVGTAVIVTLPAGRVGPAKDCGR
ncbi:MAG: sensor histidine kinase [Frankia sp.]